MRWLVRLVTPLGGTVLDPFAGTGTTGAAAFLEGFDAILIERERPAIRWPNIAPTLRAAWIWFWPGRWTRPPRSIARSAMILDAQYFGLAQPPPCVRCRRFYGADPAAVLI